MAVTRPSLRRWASRPRRRADWEERLHDWLDRAMAEPHAFGHRDCVMAALDAVEAQTGRDIAEGHRGKYRSRAGAARYLRALGFATAGELLDTQLDPIPPAFARRGDIVSVDDAPGLVLGSHAAFWLDGEARPALAPLAAWSKAWAVGAHPLTDRLALTDRQGE